MTGGMSPPQIVNSFNEGSIIVRHREYIGDVNGTVAFAKVSYDINPGIYRSFPWLAQIANAFEQYRWRGLIYEYKSTCSDAVLGTSTTPSIGTVILATDYNSPDGNQFINKMVMENHEFSNSGKPSINMIHPVECSARLNPMTRLWVRDGAIGANQDLRLYDLGSFTIATVGFPGANASVGELWVTYEVEFYKTKFSYEDAAECGFDYFNFTGATVTGTVWFGVSASTANTNNSIGGTISTSGTTYTLPSTVNNGERYLFIYHISGSAASSDLDETADYTITLGSGLATYAAWTPEGGAAAKVSRAGTFGTSAGCTITVTGWTIIQTVQVTDREGALTWTPTLNGGLAFPITNVEGQLFVQRLSENFIIS